ncbi:MAG: AAA family ATPase [Proteobacteria bacterium]|nr:AAA family ATPase [Pseudomonadota bacterium]
MPYLGHFGLKEHPFTLTPNTNQYYPTEKHTEIIQSILFGIARNTGILKVVGDVGTGKTMLCRLLLRKLVGSNDAVAYLNAPQVDPESIVTLVCAEFGIETGSRSQMLQGLNTFLLEQHALGRNAVLIVDEAQALGASGLEAVRLLSNLETERSKLLQIVMFGQSELDDLLQQPNLRQINQRIGFAFNTGPLSVAEAVHYMAHRVQTSRIESIEFPIFSDAAMERIAKAANFVPRVINILADKALLVAYGGGAIQVTEKHADGAIADSPQLVRKTKTRRWSRPVWYGVIAAQVAAVALLFALNTPLQNWAKMAYARAQDAFGIAAPAASAANPPSANAKPQ